MAEDSIVVGAGEVPQDQQVLLALQRGMLELTNRTIAAQVAAMLEVRMNVSDIINVLVEHVCKVMSLVDPEQLRNQMLAELRRNLPAVLNRHLEARMTTAGGIFVPPKDMRVN